MTTVDNPKVSQTSGKDEDPKENGLFNRPRAGGKTMWDWLNLLGILAIPLVVAGATLLFGIQQANLANQQHENDQKIANQQHDADQKRALDQQQATILQTYIDNIQDLLLNHKLLSSKPTDNVAILARARTLTALQGLDPERKGLLLIFLHEAQLIGFQDNTSKAHDAIIDLFGANLSYADIIGANLRADLSYADLRDTLLTNADLRNVELNHAIFYKAGLNGADLRYADLIGTKFDGAFLIRADLEGANFQGADLSYAWLDGANISSAAELTQEQLDQVYSCKNAILPQGLTCHHNQ